MFKARLCLRPLPFSYAKYLSGRKTCHRGPSLPPICRSVGRSCVCFNQVGGIAQTRTAAAYFLPSRFCAHSALSTLLTFLSQSGSDQNRDVSRAKSISHPIACHNDRCRQRSVGPIVAEPKGRKRAGGGDNSPRIFPCSVGHFVLLMCARRHRVYRGCVSLTHECISG